MRQLTRLAGRIYNVPLFIEEEKGQTILNVFQQYAENRIESVTIDADLRGDDEAMKAELYGVATKRTEAGYYRTDSGVAIIPVLGSLVQRGSSMDSMSGLTSYSRLGAQLSAAMNDPMIRGVVFEVDSPGGEANGIFELAASIREAGKVKPVYSVANEIAFSGGYVILAAANQAYMTEPGMTGSVGVVMYHMDRSKQMEKAGVTVTPIFAGKRKVQFSPHQPLDPEAHAWAQDHVNRAYERFANNVATHRGITVDAVKGTEAALLHSDQALSLKFVDGTATLAEVVKMASDKAMRRIHNIGTGAAVSNAHQLENSMDKQENNSAPGSTVAATTEAQTAATQAAATQAATTAAATAERQRIAGILGCDEAKGRASLAQHFATQTSMSIDEAKAALKVASVETPANKLDEAMRAQGNAAGKVGATGNTDAQAGSAAAVAGSTVVDANAIFKRRAVEAESFRKAK